MAIRSTVGNSRTINASVGEPDTPQVTRVVVEGGQQALGVASLTDVDSSQLGDGSLLVYSSEAQKWETINTLENQIVNGGTF